MKWHYDFAFSLGAACSCTESLRKAGLQFASFPFDWLYGADLRRRTDLLCNDFRGWLRLESFEFAHPARPGHKFDEYANRDTGLIHNHDFLKDTPLAETFPSVKEKYDRRVARLLRQIGKSRRALAVFLSPPTIERATDEDLSYCLSALQRKFPTVAFDVLHVAYVHDVAFADRVDRAVGEHIRVVEYDCQAKVGSEYAYAVDIDGVSSWLAEEYAVRDYRTRAEKRALERRAKAEKRAHRYAKYGASTFWGYVIGKVRRRFSAGQGLAVRAVMRDKKRQVLLIRNQEIGAGLFAVFARNLAWMKYAVNNGMQPWVDYMSQPNKFQIANGIMTDPWTNFFLQDSDFGPLDAAQAAAVYETPGIGYPPGPVPSTTPAWMKEGDEVLAMWRTFVREHVRVNPEVLRRVDGFWQVKGGPDVLGCLVRGTDYVRMRPKGHPVQPDPEQVVRDAEETCRKYGLRRVLLATEDTGVRAMFREKFGDRLIMAQEDLPEYSDGPLAKTLADGASYVEMSRQYLTSVLLLARCRCLLAGCASGTIGALLFSRGFESCRVYDLGFYD